jgi:hypothetical protein
MVYDPSRPVTSGPSIMGVAVGEPHPLPIDALPAPMPLPSGEPAPGRVLIVSGGEGDDRLVLPTGSVGSGGGGNDVFVLASSGDAGAQGSERLATIIDWNEGDRLDLSNLGENARELGRAADAGGGVRVSIDYDGDGAEDGFVLVSHRGSVPGLPSDTPARPEPIDGEYHILPFPMPGDGPFPVPGGDGGFHILPFPVTGDGPYLLGNQWSAAPAAPVDFADFDVELMSSLWRATVSFASSYDTFA